MRPAKYLGALILGCLASHSAMAQVDGTYSVTESWTVTTHIGAGANTTYSGTETGTLVVSNGGYDQINHTSAATLTGLHTTQVIGYDGSAYSIEGAYPFSAIVQDASANIYAVIQLSFFVIQVPLPEDLGFSAGDAARSKRFATTGTSLGRLSGAGSYVDVNAPASTSGYLNGVDASSTASLTLTGGGAPCTFSIAASSSSFPSTGGNGSVAVTAPSGCAWTAVSNASWITVTTGASGSGNGTVGYSAAPNTSGSPRSGTITIAGQTFTVSEVAAPTQLPQTINFGALNNQLLGTAPFALNATASSGLAVVFASNTTSVCTVSGATATLLAIGTCSITASQPGNSTYAAATPVTQTFTITAVPLSGGAAIAAGAYHTCALTIAGGVLCWGDNSAGELGDGTTTQRPTPAAVSGLGSGVVAIAAGVNHTCALTTAGGVLCWGDNTFGELGDGTTTTRLTPVAVRGLGSGVAAIAAGGATCALTIAGGVLCWGDNTYGEIGDGTTSNRLTPVAVSGLGSGVAAIAAGAVHTCALTTAGGVLCWGDDTYGELGDGSGSFRRFLTPVAVSGLGSGVAAIAAGDGFHTCALTTAGGVLCWGDDTFGELGDGSGSFLGFLTPVAVSGLGSGVVAIAAGVAHTCALTTGGGVLCWGSNEPVLLPTVDDSLTPVAVSGLGSGVAAIAAGYSYTCALTTAGGVLCWGDNGFGQLGNGGVGLYVTTPRTVVTVTTTVVEYYNASQDHYFMTWVPQEISDLDTGVHVGWARTGQTFQTYVTAQTGTSPVCRFYIPPALGDSHFYGRGTTECNATAQNNPSFVLEDPAFMQMFLPNLGVCPTDTMEVYRVFDNRPDANHRYMTDKTIEAQMVAKGWVAEGDGPNLVVMCAPQ